MSCRKLSQISQSPGNAALEEVRGVLSQLLCMLCCIDSIILCVSGISKGRVVGLVKSMCWGRYEMGYALLEHNHV